MSGNEATEVGAYRRKARDSAVNIAPQRCSCPISAKTWTPAVACQPCFEGCRGDRAIAEPRLFSMRQSTLFFSADLQYRSSHICIMAYFALCACRLDGMWHYRRANRALFDTLTAMRLCIALAHGHKSGLRRRKSCASPSKKFSGSRLKGGFCSGAEKAAAASGSQKNCGELERVESSRIFK